jgi:hypothetical protein
MHRTTRRAFLRGAGGATLSLPWLESLTRGNEPAVKPSTRLAIFYVPIGVVRRGFFPGEANADIPTFTSSQEEINVDARMPVGMHPFESLTPTQRPLERVRDKVTFISGMLNADRAS